MATTFDDSHSKVIDLIDNFEAHQSVYKRPSYQEAENRADFIDPFLIALGWDVHHRVQKNPWEQEVKVERSVDVDLSQKRADYAFYSSPNYRDVRFYVEAKKPSVNLLSSTSAHFQTLRYGWNSSTPFALLTDFEHFVVLDCRRKPRIDTCLKQAVIRIHFTALRDPKEFARLYDLFSRDAVADNSLEKLVQQLDREGKGSVAREPVDDTFLAELEAHRVTIARLLRRADTSLDSGTLTEITQRVIDRLVFLRFLEDKLIEPQYRVADIGKRKSPWTDFVEFSKRLDATYNGVIFKTHSRLDNPELDINQKAFRGVCEQLSHLDSPYNFNAIPIHILGSVYERFLGNVIVVSGSSVRAVPKPEVRKAGGVFYTPEPIVRFIVNRTVGELVEGKEPKEVWGMRFADIACGSGSFLLGIFDFLLQYLERWYNDSSVSPAERKSRDAKAKNHGCQRDATGVWQLSLGMKREILTKCIYGVDIDHQAVEVSQLSLFLKLLENESTATARQFSLEFGGARPARVLPDLSRNIVCGNSLVQWDYAEFLDISQSEAETLNPLDYEATFPHVFSSGGFDAVIGNPPYVDSEWMTKHLKNLRTYCTQAYRAAAGNWDLFCVFVERALELCREGGLSSMIVPNKLGSANYARELRSIISEKRLVSIRDYSAVPVFPVSVYPIVYVIENESPRGDISIEYERMRPSPGLDDVGERTMLSRASHFMPAGTPWKVFSDIGGVDVCAKVAAAGVPLASIAEVLGAATVAEAYEIADIVSEGGSGLRLVNSGTIDPFLFYWGSKPCRYLKKTYLKPVIRKTDQPSLPKKRLQQSLSPKVVIAGMTKRLECAADLEGAYLAGKSTTIVTWDGDLPYLTALLNSQLVNFYYDTNFGGDRLQGGYLRVGPPQVGTIPVLAMGGANSRRLAIQKSISTLALEAMKVAEQMVLEDRSTSHSFHARRLEDTKRKIDLLVFELYDLSEQDIRAITGEGK